MRHDRVSRPGQRHDGGFTLVEVLIVIVILGILATVTVFAVRGITDRGQENSEAADLRTLETAVEAYWLEHGANPTVQDLVDEGYLREPSTLHTLAVDGSGALTITNVRTGTVASNVSAGGGGGAGGGGAGGAGGGAGSGTIAGTVTDAADEAPIAGAEVCVRGGGACATTDGTGAYSIADVAVGDVSVDITATGYSALDDVITIADGATATLDVALSAQLAAGDLRIVLTWGENPRDLDSYLWAPSGTQVWYGGRGSLTSAPFAQLDVDDTNGFGPETITISQLDSGSYSFAVRALGGGNFVPAETTVRVYDSSGQIGEFVPPAGDGRWWRVFTLNGSTGSLTTVNTVGDAGGPF